MRFGSYAAASLWSRRARPLRISGRPFEEVHGVRGGSPELDHGGPKDLRGAALDETKDALSRDIFVWRSVPVPASLYTHRGMLRRLLCRPGDPDFGSALWKILDGDSIGGPFVEVY